MDTESSSQLKYSTDWGTLLPDKPPATIEEQIAAKKAELAEYVPYVCVFGAGFMACLSILFVD